MVTDNNLAAQYDSNQSSYQISRLVPHPTIPSMSTNVSSRLFQPITIGNLKLNHRIVLPPLTRYRATRLTHVPINSMVKTHYEQRASVPGTLPIAEATFIAAKAGGEHNIPGIWNKEQIDAWKEVTDAVHTKGSYIFVQIWALGRMARISHLQEGDPSLPYIAPSPIPLPRREGSPRELTVPEIKEYITLFAQAAINAIEAGFDGVEIHNANGYLLDQFVKEVSNHRTDEYGGSIENRSRLTLEVVKAIVDVIGAERTGIRFSPWGIMGGMKIDDPIPQFTYLIQQLVTHHPKLAYLHLIEPLDSGPEYADKSNDNLRVIWHPRPLISAGEYIMQSALDMVERWDNELIGFGRAFIANPDFPFRIRYGLPLNVPDEKTFYTAGDEPDTAVGYIDYPFYSETVEKQKTDSIAAI